MGFGHAHAGHDHGHGHTHNHGRTANRKALLLTVIIITAFFIVEVTGGILTNSLALLSDAGHMFSDSSALFLSLFALWFSSRPPSPQKTYGYYRFEILAALLNGVTLILISLFIFWESYQRLQNPPQVASVPMIGIATLGLFANIAAALILMRGDYKQNLNIRSAFLHVLGDLLGSAGAILAGILMWQFGWYAADPLISIFVGILILISAWRVTKESINILMEGVPSTIDIAAVTEALLAIPGVRKVYDLHVWTVTSGFDSLSCHLLVDDEVSGYEVLNQALARLETQFHIMHSTIQIENSTVKHGHVSFEKHDEGHHR
jgi:cobalt-zinc-cadmium efflux system protein